MTHKGILQYLVDDSVKWDNMLMKVTALLMIVLSVAFGFHAIKPSKINSSGYRRKVTDNDDDDEMTTSDTVVFFNETNKEFGSMKRARISKNQRRMIIKQARRLGADTIGNIKNIRLSY